MQKITVTCPPIGLEAYFSFKEPVTRSLQNRLGTSSNQILLKVSAINEIKEMMQSELRDPFLEAYAPAGLEQAQYNQDLIDNIQIITFKYTALDASVKYVRVPMTYVHKYDSVLEIAYLDRSIVVNLGLQHQDLSLESLHAQLVDFIQTRTGIISQLKEVSLGDPLKITADEHANREAVRVNSITVFKTTETQLEEMRIKYQGLVDRISQMGIVLG